MVETLRELINYMLTGKIHKKYWFLVYIEYGYTVKIIDVNTALGNKQGVCPSVNLISQ